MGSFILELVVIVTVGLLITTLLRAFVFQPFEVPSGSMENTLQVNDKIVALRVIDFKRGDIVVFADAHRWLGAPEEPGPGRRALEFVGILPNSSEGHLVKRVIGLPGDRVSCCDELGRLSVNGVPLEESAYLFSDPSGQVKPAEKPFEVVVPAGHIFVMGDHRNASGDSRCHLQDVSMTGGPAGQGAFIPVDAVVGTVTMIMSPLNRIQWFETPDAYAAIPPPTGPAPAEGEIVRVSDGC
ncbi:signal peptidase I [Ammonicoccus fulvus]|uniref:Signal peptidase I n=1 Tax=Ammonicoccus fulvus TaxID=3138240 RepID=A0ABZ3FXC9_9ACTN